MAMNASMSIIVGLGLGASLVSGVSGCQSSVTANDGSGSGTTTGTTDPDPSATSAGCPTGAELCPCTSGGGCDPGLVCVAGTCVSEDCALGSNACPCTAGGGCDPGLECNDGICGPATSDTTSATTGDPTNASDPDSSSDPTTPSDSSGESSSDTGSPAGLDAWTRRRPVLVTNANDVALTEHQVKIDLDWDDDFAPGLADLRFTDESGTELLPYWVESSLAPVEARVWVRVPAVPAEDEATIYMWYGNPAAVADEQPAAVFDHWEDFDGNDLPAGWSATDEYTVANGRLTITAGSVYSNVPLTSFPGAIVEIRSRIPNAIGAGTPALSVAEAQGAVGDQDIVQFLQSPPFLQAVGENEGTLVGVAWQSPPGPNASVYEWYMVGMGGGVVRFGRTHEDSDGSLWWQDFPADLPNDYYVWLGHPNGSLAEANDIEDTDIDALLVRKFALDPPDVSIGGEEDL